MSYSRGNVGKNHEKSTPKTKIEVRNLNARGPFFWFITGFCMLFFLIDGRNPANQNWYGTYPLIYRFVSSQVIGWDFWTISDVSTPAKTYVQSKSMRSEAGDNQTPCRFDHWTNGRYVRNWTQKLVDQRSPKSPKTSKNHGDQVIIYPLDLEIPIPKHSMYGYMYQHLPYI